MSDKLPQPTATLVKRLRRTAKAIDEWPIEMPEIAKRDPATISDERARRRAMANTCLQAAGRLEALAARDAAKETR